MNPQTFEIAVFAQTVFRLAIGDSVDEMIAIACAIRNCVIPPPGQHQLYKTFPEAFRNFLTYYPVREEPTMQEESLMGKNGLLSVIEDIYTCAYTDITATESTIGARFFARTASLSPDDWRWQIIRSHPLIGTFGAQQFYS